MEMILYRKQLFQRYSTFLLTITACFLSCNNTENNYRNNRTDREKLTIEIVPILLQNPTLFMDDIHKRVKTIYGFNVVIADNIGKLPISYINRQKGIRYSADSIIKHLANRSSSNYSISLGYTSSDIYITKYDHNGLVKHPKHKYEVWGIFGLAKYPGNSCVISTKRLYSPDTGIFKQRVLKVTLHEIGHNLGLKHCPNKSCFMTDAVESISTVDNASLNLCDKCNKQIDN